MNESNNTTTTPQNTAEHALSVWMEMWNTGGKLAREICSGDFRIHFGTSEPDGSNPADAIVGAEDFGDFLDWYRQEHPEFVFTGRHHALDGAHGRMLWDVRAGEAGTGGIDIFDFTSDGLIREVWSVTGARSLVG